MSAMGTGIEVLLVCLDGAKYLAFSTTSKGMLMLLTHGPHFEHLLSSDGHSPLL